MPNEISITKSDGTVAGPMKQPQAESYMLNVINDISLKSNLTQSLNDVFDDKGKATGHYVHNGQKIKHASAGKTGAGASVSLFWTHDHSGIKIVAAGEHTVSTPNLTEYKLCFYGQASGQMKNGATVSLVKK
ncbi:hypothetical protein [Falsihalocynthiibacter arcticus]|uniref:Uncharacterized protein n=1 Tax=Falsihalocynthiibacter arcticus TaxID=1579316 RepID=A0A126V052_9RHOB|nr:hypothetical protein [Falsihalocynthiibacter arcticus]AML51701.1 hypothetical protein RC74_10895 [Falsihalocynthiibacter arcticus]